MSEYREYYKGWVTIWFGTYNICNGRNGGLESALRGMSQANMDLGIFQETNVTGRLYTNVSTGYSVIATDVPIQHRGGVAVFNCLVVGAVQQFRLNVVRFQMETGE